ncbi:unnamed protein product [Caenorhabditis brenneri]
MTEDNLLTVCTDYFRNSTLTRQEVNDLIYPRKSGISFQTICIVLAFFATYGFAIFGFITEHWKEYRARKIGLGAPGSLNDVMVP